MTSNVAIAVAAAALLYALFGAFNSRAGGRIDPALSSAIFNGVAALLSLAIFLVLKYASDADVLPTRASGALWSVAAGVAVGAFSILLIAIYGRGGQLAWVFPTIYGGAIALTFVIGWLILRDAVSPLRVAGVAVIVAGIAMLARG